VIERSERVSQSLSGFDPAAVYTPEIKALLWKLAPAMRIALANSRVGSLALRYVHTDSQSDGAVRSAEES